MESDAYKNGGAIAITFDQAPQTGEHADSGGLADIPPPRTCPLPPRPLPPTATPPAEPTLSSFDATVWTNSTGPSADDTHADRGR